jgi:ADP-ribosylation factor 2-binding protein
MAEFKDGGVDISLDSEDAEEIFAENSGSAEDIEFDMILGALEDILMDGELSQLQKEFCERHCIIFEETEENKLEYTELFNQYTALIESNLNEKLRSRIPGFEMSMFESLLKGRDEEELSGEIFEILLSFTDFGEFKEYMLSVKRGLRGHMLSVDSRKIAP